MASHNINKHFLLAVLALVTALAIPDAHAEGILDKITNHAAAGSSGWIDAAIGFAKTLFFGLAALEFAWATTQLVLQKGEISEMVVGLLMKIITISFFMMILTYAPEWMAAIRDSFVQAAGGITGTSVSALTPSGMFDKGLDVSARMLSTIPDSANPFKELFFSIIAGLSALMIIIGYGVIALQLAITLIEMYLVIGAGALMLGFMGSRWTMSFGERYLGYAISTGVKLLMIYLIAAFGDTLTTAIISNLTTMAAVRGSDGLAPTDMLGLGGASLMFGAAGYLVPGIAGSMLNGSPSMSMSNVSAAGKGAASMPVSAALSAGAAGAQMLGGAASLASKFGGGSAAGSIAGAPGGGSTGSIFGAPGGGKGGGGSTPGGDAGSISNTPPGGGKGSGGTAGGGKGGGDTSAGGKDGGSNKSKDSGKSGAGSTSNGKGSGGGGKGSGEATDGSKMNAGQAQATGKNAGSTAAAANSPTGSAPGFQNPNDGGSGPSPRSMDPDRRLHDHMQAGAGGGQSAAQQPQQGKLARLAGVLSNYSREMQYAANRQNTNMGNDGNTGSAPSIRLNI